MTRRPPTSPLFPYTTLFRSTAHGVLGSATWLAGIILMVAALALLAIPRSEEHTLNSSHRTISYAVFCLKKKKIYSHNTFASTTHLNGSIHLSLVSRPASFVH